MGFIKKGIIEARQYQQNIAESVLEKGSTLVVLPTGLGKTIVALLVIDKILGKGKKVLFLSPTKPLAEQHWKKLLESLEVPEENLILLTGEKKAERREREWKEAIIVVATPQTVQNDLKKKIANLKGYGLCVFDEAHRTVGKYAYTFVAEECKRQGVKTLGLTASPGADRKKIEEIMACLEIKNVETRVESDEDVETYVKPVEMRWIEVELPEEYKEIRKPLEELISKRVGTLRKLGYLFPNAKRVGKRGLMEVQKKILRSRDSWKKFRALSLHAALMNLLHAHELLETQSISAFKEFFSRMEERRERSKAVAGILEDRRIKEMLERAKSIEIEHPKMKRLKEVVSDESKTYIVFVQYRDQVKKIVEELREAGINAEKFLGKRKGVTQKEQQKTIRRFREGEFNVLVASSIGEEGLDIPGVDCVVFYEPVASEIRSIQRRGRAGRAKAGEVVFLITKRTRDEVAYWAAQKKEKRMRKMVAGWSKKGEGMGGKAERAKKQKPRGQSRISDYFE
ncbi:hypothetical protein DRN67_01535 [Candidatus Micrarchaeota archaeon]|nr:MAG: hypothetical protein DRN67_01535 [Candidatus Micrarchaeota archaeon]